jgi:hypothetical protein
MAIMPRSLIGGVGNDDAAGGLFLGIDAIDDDAVVKRTELHGSAECTVIKYIASILSGCLGRHQCKCDKRINRGIKTPS